MNEPDIRTPKQAQPVALNIEVGHGRVEIRTSYQPAAVRAEPMTPNDQVALDLIARARITDTGDRLDVRFPDPPGVSSGYGNVFMQGGGAIHMSGISIVNGDVVMNGVRAGGGGLNVTAIVPPGSTVTLRTKTADAIVLGRTDEIQQVNFNSTSGDLHTEGVAIVHATTVSGDIEADEARGGQFKTTSGDVELARLRGDVSLNSISGDLDAHCLVPAVVYATTVSGDVSVTSAPGVRPDVRASTVSGKTRVR